MGDPWVGWKVPCKLAKPLAMCLADLINCQQLLSYSYPVIPEVRCLLQAMQELSSPTQNNSAYYYYS